MRIDTRRADRGDASDDGVLSTSVTWLSPQCRMGHPEATQRQRRFHD